MKENRDLEVEIDGKHVCDVCDEAVGSTTPIVVNFGEVELCEECLTEDATRADANAAAARKWDRDIDPTSVPDRDTQRTEETDK